MTRHLRRVRPERLPPRRETEQERYERESSERAALSLDDVLAPGLVEYVYPPLPGIEPAYDPSDDE
jgi:hypothetical protein